MDYGLQITDFFVTLHKIRDMSNTYFEFKRFTVHQERCGMKVGTDGCLLGAWAVMPPAERCSPHILDVGTGTGLIALMMAQRYPEARVTAVEIDAEAAGQAQENVQQSPFASRIEVVQADYKDMQGVFSSIVSNPPYFINALDCPDPQRSLARHNNSLTYDTLMQHAAQLLAAEGEVSVIVPFDNKANMEHAAALAGLVPSRTCLVKTTERKAPRRCLMAFRKAVNCDVEYTELVIGSSEFRALMHDFYLKM